MTTRQDDPAVIIAEVNEVIAAVEAIDPAAPWSEIAEDLRLTLPRRRAMPQDVDDLVVRDLPPGIEVGLGLDIGPAMLFVAAEQLDGWGVTADQAYEQAFANVRARVAASDHFALIHEVIADAPTIAFQSGEGWASSLLLLPDQLCHVLGVRDGLILAPMRDVIIQVPLGVERDFAHWLFEEFASVDMNALDLPLFSLVDGRLRKAMEVRRPAPGDVLVH